MGLFGKKKQPTPAPVEFNQQLVMGMPPEIARAVIMDWSQHHGGATPATLSAKLVIDEQGRVATISDPVAEGVPFVPSFEVVGRLNEILRPFSAATEIERALSFSFTFDNGAFSGRFEYPPAPAS